MPSIVSIAGRLETKTEPPEHMPPTLAPRVENVNGRTKLYDGDELMATVQSNGDILFESPSVEDLKEERNEIEAALTTHSILPPNPTTTLYVTTATVRFEETPSKTMFTAHPLFRYYETDDGPAICLANEPSFYLSVLGVSTLATVKTQIPYEISAFERSYNRFAEAYEDAKRSI